MSWETNTGRSAREGWQGNVTAAMSPSVNHGGANLHRFHEDQTQHLQSYTCFHGDELPRTGEPLLSLRRSIHSNGPNSLLPTAKLQDLSVGALYGSGYRNMQAKVKAADSVIQGMGSRLGPYTGRGVTLGGAMGNTLKTATGSPADSGVVYEYPTGTYASKSGLPPLAYKPWSTEYVDEYRTPAVMKETLSRMTEHYGTGDALRTSRFQHQGYPPSFNALESSLGKRGQTGPRHESRVVAF
ncbi:uncharacterized protein HaLaN_11937 [Haematococcus lacustris]|uniref:Uncharacterized protein n=1 Tax=Haematococcus lacustris TaxID=44745 RepID=A0A699Z982_HAELA|nr:uncharacterized protein HaLaN_11937 [Haematococcus lacustris]